MNNLLLVFGIIIFIIIISIVIIILNKPRKTLITISPLTTISRSSTNPVSITSIIITNPVSTTPYITPILTTTLLINNQLEYIQIITTNTDISLSLSVNAYKDISINTSRLSPGIYNAILYLHVNSSVGVNHIIVSISSETNTSVFSVSSSLISIYSFDIGINQYQSFLMF